MRVTTFRAGDVRHPFALARTLAGGATPPAAYLWSLASDAEREDLIDALDLPEPEGDARITKGLITLLNRALREQELLEEHRFVGVKLDRSLKRSLKRDPNDPGTRRSLLQRAFPLEIGPEPTPRRRLERCLYQVLRESSAAWPNFPLKFDTVLKELLPQSKHHWVSDSDLALAREVLDCMGRAGLIVAVNGTDASEAAYVVHPDLCPYDEMELRLRANPVAALATSAERVALPVLLAISVLGLWIFYLRFLPEQYKSEATAFNTWVTAIAGFLGVKGLQVGADLTRGLNRALQGWVKGLLWFPVLILFVSVSLALGVGIYKPHEIRTNPGAVIKVDSKEVFEVPDSLGDRAATLVTVPLWLSWGSHTITVTKRFYGDPATGDPELSFVTRWPNQRSRDAVLRSEITLITPEPPKSAKGTATKPRRSEADHLLTLKAGHGAGLVLQALSASTHPFIPSAKHHNVAEILPVRGRGLLIKGWTHRDPLSRKTSLLFTFHDHTGKTRTLYRTPPVLEHDPQSLRDAYEGLRDKVLELLGLPEARYSRVVWENRERRFWGLVTAIAPARKFIAAKPPLDITKSKRRIRLVRDTAASLRPSISAMGQEKVDPGTSALIRSAGTGLVVRAGLEANAALSSGDVKSARAALKVIGGLGEPAGTAGETELNLAALQSLKRVRTYALEVDEQSVKVADQEINRVQQSQRVRPR